MSTLSIDRFPTAGGAKLEKGMVREALQYSSEMKLSYKGSAIKEKIVAVKAACELQKAKCKLQMEHWQKLCGNVGPVQSYRDSAMAQFGIQAELKCYSYEQKSAFAQAYNTKNPPAQGSRGMRAYDTPCEKYNSCVFQYYDACCDIAYLNAMSEGIEDKKTYQLEPRAAVALGFGVGK